MKYQFSVCRTLSSIFILALLTFTIYFGGSVMVFIHIPSFITVCGLGFFIVLAVYELEFLKFIPHALCLLAYRPSGPNPRFAQIALFASRSIIGAGIIAMIIGLIQMLQNLSSPSSIGAGMAVAMLSPFYAVVVSEVFCAIAYQSFKDAQIKSDKEQVLPAINAGLPLLMILFTVCVFMILSLSFAGAEAGFH